MDKVWSQILSQLNARMLYVYVFIITSFIMHEILRIISCLMKHMRMQLVPGPSLFRCPAKKVGLGTRLGVGIEGFQWYYLDFYVFPFLALQCKLFVDTFGPQLIQLLTKVIDPQALCSVRKNIQV